MHYWFFSDWSRQTQTHPRSFRFGRFIRLRQAVVTVRCIVVWSELKVSSGALAKDQIACESKSRGQSDSTQEPPLATAQAMTWESTTKYCHTLLLDLLHSSPQHSTYINSPEATTNHSYKISIVCIMVIGCMDKSLPWKRLRHGDRFQHLNPGHFVFMFDVCCRWNWCMFKQC